MEARLTQTAEGDLDSIFEYVATEAGLETADQLLDRIGDSIRRLQEFPQLGRRREELDAFGLLVRSLPQGNYSIFYVVGEKYLWVVRVLHMARELRPEMLISLLEVGDRPN